MANYNFKSDLRIGEEGEADVIQYLESKGAKFISNNKDNAYDVIMQYKGEEITYEIKTDVFCAPIADTGNIFLEFECRGKASGVTVTKAKWFVMYFIFLKEMWFIETEDLRELIKNNEFPVSEQSGDANSNTKGYLVKRNTIRDNFKVVRV